MSSERKHIIVAHRSHIVFHGLTSLFKMGKLNFNADHVTSIDQLERMIASKKYDYVFISPQVILNCEDQFNHLRNKSNAKYIGLLQDGFARDTRTQFDEILYLYDSESTILDVFNKLEKQSDTNSFDKSMLSDRELDVLKLIVEGYSNKEIGEKLFISTHTVITHRKNITQKTGIKSVSGLTIFAVLNKLVEVDNYF